MKIRAIENLTLGHL